MFIDAMGLIIADTKRITLGELSKPRALAAVPFGGRFRIVDFILSGMVNSGIKSVGVIAQNKYRSLMDHLGTGAPWDLDRKNLGLSILPPYVTTEFSDMTASDELMGILNFVRTNPLKYVVAAHSNVIFNTTFNEMLEEHEKSGADVTLICNRDGNKFGAPNYIMEVDRKGYVTEMLVDPEKSTSMQKAGLVVDPVKAQEKAQEKASEFLKNNPHKMKPHIRKIYKTKGGTPHLDGAYTVFGEVVKGMDVVEKIAKQETDHADRPKEDIKIIKIKINE